MNTSVERSEIGGYIKFTENKNNNNFGSNSEKFNQGFRNASNLGETYKSRRTEIEDKIVKESLQGKYTINKNLLDLNRKIDLEDDIEEADDSFRNSLSNSRLLGPDSERNSTVSKSDVSQKFYNSGSFKGKNETLGVLNIASKILNSEILNRFQTNQNTSKRTYKTSERNTLERGSNKSNNILYPESSEIQRFIDVKKALINKSRNRVP